MNVNTSRPGQELTVTDLFCGAGGSSIGAEAGGARLRMAANHWKLAVETHALNFPDADHDCADVSQVDPRRYPRTDILLASPECTHHSMARSEKHQPDLFNPDGDPAAERSRATMWDVPRFAERHHYQAVIVENVTEITRWAPFEAWLSAMDSLGYRHQVVSLNSMVAWPTPQSRDRLYVVFSRIGNRKPDLDIRPPSWCPKCEARVEGVQSFKNGRGSGKYRQQYVYRCPVCSDQVQPLVYSAATAIDWDLPTPRIGDRTSPLADATRRRIQLGLDRFGPAIVQNAGHCYEANRDDPNGYVRAWPLGNPIMAQTATLQHGLALPPEAMIVPLHHGADGPLPRSTNLPMPTQTGRQENALCIQLRNHANAYPVGAAPWMTMAAGGNHHGIIIKNYGDGRDPSMAKLADAEPLGTVTSIDHHSLVALPFTVDYHGKGEAHRVDGPLPTQDTRDRHGLVQPAPDLDDCGFRMLDPAEVGRAMAFPTSYTVKGTKRDRVRQFGNAVTPPAMTLLVQRAIDSLAADVA